VGWLPESGLTAGFEGLAADILAKAAPNLSSAERRFVPIEAELQQLVQNPGESPTASEPGYPVAAMGGTFDHLHAAHKLLLHMALFATEQRLIVGVMADRLLATKSHAELLEGLDTRLGAATAFLRRCGGEARGIVLDVVEIQDALGPTAWDPEISMLAVSKETLSGGNYVNRVRGEKGLSILDMLAIDVISSEFAHDKRSTRDLSAVDDALLKDAKMGSTGLRDFIAQQKQG
jgi:pantetheine-phosphate adenylyltransferase